MILFNIPSWIQFIFPSILWRVDTDKKEVFLTFDDGPTPEVTYWILELLKKFDAKASFFCLGKNIIEYPEIVSLLVKEGHQIGNHTFTHVNAQKVIFADYLEEIKSTEKLISNNIFRPPYGKLTIQSFFRLREKYRIVLWDIMSYDFDANQDIKSVLLKLKKSTKKGSIIVFHDNVKSFERLKIILPEYLQWLYDENYSFNKIN